MAATKVDTVGTEGGSNIIDPPFKCRGWSITWFDYPEDHSKIFDTVTQKYLYQVELCPTTGRPHLQGAAYFANAVTAKYVQACFPGCCQQGARSWKALIKYCQKEETSTGQRFAKGVKVKKTVRKVPDPLEGSEPVEWQQELIELVNHHCTKEQARQVHWFWSQAGGVGKTAVAKHLVLKHIEEVLYVSTSKGSDIKCAIAGFLEEGKDLRAIIYNIPRASKDVCYSTLEEICDGIFFSGKYESRMVTFAPVHVVVFANFPPNKNQLSVDRWVVKCVDAALTDTPTPPSGVPEGTS